MLVDCPASCPSSWLSDGMCDSACNNPECNYDNGDCDDSSSANCPSSCPSSWLSDGMCDSQCNSPECNYDDGDCGRGGFPSDEAICDLVDRRCAILKTVGFLIAFYPSVMCDPFRTSDIAPTCVRIHHVCLSCLCCSPRIAGLSVSSCPFPLLSVTRASLTRCRTRSRVWASPRITPSRKVGRSEAAVLRQAHARITHRPCAHQALSNQGAARCKCVVPFGGRGLPGDDGRAVTSAVRRRVLGRVSPTPVPMRLWPGPRGGRAGRRCSCCMLKTARRTHTERHMHTGTSTKQQQLHAHLFFADRTTGAGMPIPHLSPPARLWRATRRAGRGSALGAPRQRRSCAAHTLHTPDAHSPSHDDLSLRELLAGSRADTRVRNRRRAAAAGAARNDKLAVADAHLAL